MSHLVIVTPTGIVATPPVDRDAAMVALGLLATAGTHDTAPHGRERLLVLETDAWITFAATAARMRRQ